LNRADLPLAFDTGPGNMIIDYCTERATNGAQAFDRDGLIAAQGHVHNGLLAELLSHSYLAQPAPKTTGRETFGAQFGQWAWERGTALGLTPESIVATVTAFTAESIAAAYRSLIPWPIEEIYIAGGGAFNPTLCAMIGARTGIAVQGHDALGIPS